jgi:hypothetical protein
MAITSNHVTGFVLGLGAAAAGFYVYRQNQDKVDAWLRRQGINVAGGSGGDPRAMPLEDLVAEKERLEDIIAEREMAEQEVPSPEDAAPQTG